MSRLLLVTESASPEPHRSAMADRVVAFCAALREAGHTVSLAPAVAGSEADAAPAARYADGDAHGVEAMMENAMAVAWDGVIAVGLPDALARGARMADRADVPLWLDIDDAVPAIIDSHPDAQRDLAWALARADRLSAPHVRLEEILLGQLGFVGRLNRLTIGEPLTAVDRKSVV